MKAPRFSPRAAWMLLVVLALARVAASFSHSMWAWGLEAGRFVHPGVAWGALALLALSLAPPVGEALGPRLAWLGDLLARSRVARLLAALLAALLAWAMADQLWFLGDFMLRQGAIQGESMATMFQQSLPLDILFHGLVPRTIAGDPAVVGSAYSRLLGACEAGVLLLLALRFARSLELTGAAYLAAAGVVFFGGHLAFFTGLAKPAGEMCLFTVATVVFGTSLAREGRGGYALGICLALAFGLHRESLVLLPAWLLAWGLWFRRHRRGPGRIAGLVALLLPAMMLVRALPEILRIAGTFDLSRHVLTPEVARAGGPLLAAFAPLRVVDLANLAMVLAPLGLIGLSWLASSSRRGSLPGTLLAVLGLAAVPILVFLHPQQGVFRDWDVFAPIGTTLCLLAAMAIGSTIEEARSAWLAAPVLASAVLPTLLVLTLYHDVDRGLRYVRAFVTETPTRSERDQAFVWDYLGTRSFRLARWDVAAEALAHDDRLQPTRRVRLIWAIAETMRGNYAGAAAVYSMVLARDPKDPIAWLGLAGAAKRTGDRATFGRAAPMVSMYLGVPAAAKEIRKFLSYYPQAWPADSLSSDSLR